MNLDGLKEFTSHGISMAIASRGVDLCPELIDGMGLQWQDDQRVTVFVESREAAQSLLNFRENKMIAISMARPCDYSAAQIKGTVAQVRPMTSAETEFSQTWSKLFHTEIQLIGVPSLTAESARMIADTAVELHIDELYIQTPGPDAGRPLEEK
jgi:hypothetical protein